MYTAKYIHRKNLNLLQWENFITANSGNMVYFHHWYMDCVSREWNAIIVEKNGEWVAVMPVEAKRKYFIRYSTQPVFSKYLGIVFRNDILADKGYNEIQKKIQYLIVNAIPSSVQFIDYNFHPGFSYFLPLCWMGFHIRPCFTYRLNILQPDKNQYSTSITNHINKSIKAGLACTDAIDMTVVLKIAIQRHIISNAAANIFNNLWQKLKQENKGIQLSVTDKDGNIHSSAIFAIDGGNAFMILSFLNPKYKRLGGNSLLINEAIKLLNKRGIKWFYFEGSMLENVEKYIRGYRPEPILYYNVYRYRLLILNIVVPTFKKLYTVKHRIPASGYKIEEEN